MINEEAMKKKEKWKIEELTRNCFCVFSWTVGGGRRRRRKAEVEEI
jgi:hypothetical protein